jgi:signal transduction histidine kinase
MGAIARQAAESLSIQAKVKGLSLELSVQPALRKIYGSTDQISEIYTNLIDNAIKYTASGGLVSVKINEEGDSIKSVISDTGIGIEPDDVAKIFDRFKRLETILGHKAKGTDLGLAISKEIVESHGGRIWVESSSGKGSNFIFTIPFGLRDIDKKQTTGHKTDEKDNSRRR